jgi:LacI family transcriptional regulator
MKPQRSVILLVPSAREFDRGFRRGVFEYAHTHGPWVFYEEAPAYLQRLTPGQRLRHLRDWKADGLIVVQSRYPEVASLALPTVVAIGTHTLGPEYAQAVCADVEIGRMGARTLLGLGLRNFAYCGLEGLDFSDNRGAGFRREVEQAGSKTEVYSSSTQHSGKSWYVEEKLLARWLVELRKPVGLMACNDDRARTVAEICRMSGIRVPDDVAILGVDNDEQVCRSANPPISSIALATERGGYDAAALLQALMQGKKPSKRTVTVHPTREVRRQSTDILAIQDPFMLRALRFIRENSNRNIRVHEVSSAARLSLRALQDRFWQELGHTPLEEVHRSRVDRIAQLLLETNMSVGEIGRACGFDEPSHVARFFARRTGMTPLAYRQKLKTA